jgi:amidase
VRGLRRLLLLAAAAVVGACARAPAPADAGLLELDAPTLERELAAGQLSAEALTRAALERIAALDDAGPALGAIIEVNPDALAVARELDRRFAEHGPVGPLHGLPVVLKANIDTADRMATSAGSLALAEHHADVDAELVARLRAAGAVILAKTNLSEWANFRSTRSTSGWSSVGGQTRNPYVLDRSPCGSSSGSAVAVAARLVPLAVGTETDGSIVCPAGMNGVVGIKPTLGLVSQRGLVPVAAGQDTAGPLARTVRGAAMLLAAMQTNPANADLGSSERADLRGIRLGIVRDYYGAGHDSGVETALERWLVVLRGAGAELVDPIEIALPEGFREAELETLLYEFKAGIDRYLAATRAEPGSLAALIAFNRERAAEVMPYFGQDLLVMAEARGSLDERAYREAVDASRALLRARLARVFRDGALDALVAPVNAPAYKIDWREGDRFSVSSSGLAAVSGYPSVAVPGGLVGELPVGLAFIGEPGSEARLIEIARVFERRTGPLPAPTFIRSLER